MPRGVDGAIDNRPKGWTGKNGREFVCVVLFQMKADAMLHYRWSMGSEEKGPLKSRSCQGDESLALIGRVAYRGAGAVAAMKCGTTDELVCTFMGWYLVLIPRLGQNVRPRLRNLLDYVYALGDSCCVTTNTVSSG